MDVTVRKMDVRHHGSLIRRHLNLRFSRVWIYVDGDRVEIILWFYITRVKIGRVTFGHIKSPSKTVKMTPPTQMCQKSFVWASFGLLESESRNEIYRKGVGES